MTVPFAPWGLRTNGLTMNPVALTPSILIPSDENKRLRKLFFYQLARNAMYWRQSYKRSFVLKRLKKS
jgi:hypothetical protein